MAEEKRLSKLNECVSQLTPRSGKGDEPSNQDSEAPAAREVQLVCPASALVDGGDGVRFEISWNAETAPAFAIRHSGRVYGYLNRCAHISMELDWKPGKFFDGDGEYLICSTHGALYAPHNGACRGGPCRGAPLVGLDVFESNGNIYVKRG